MKMMQLTSMRRLPFVFLVAIAILFLLPVFVSENNVGACAIYQTPTDSIIAPNVFTPNGDGKNDFFEVRSTNKNHEVLLKIYTRTGVLVYQFVKKHHAWDGYSLNGRPMANGVYFYEAEVRGVSPKISKSGCVHLYR